MKGHIAQFTSGEVLGLQLRTVQASVKTMKETLDSVKRFLRAWGKASMPDEISFLKPLSEQLDDVVSFCKGAWPKMTALKASQASEATERVVNR